MSYQVQIDTTRFNVAMSQLARGLGKDCQDETLRQAKFLCIQLAASAPPRPKDSKPLAANIPKKKANSIRGAIGSIVKSVKGMPLRQVAASNDASVFTNSIHSKGSPSRYHVAATKLATGAVMFSKATESPLWRIYKAAKTDPVKALKNLRQVLKNHAVQAPLIYNNFMGKAVEAYYASLAKKSKQGKGGNKDSIEKVFINTKKVKEERLQLLAEIEPHIGTVKAGWIQAGLQIPIKAGPRIPAWLLNKKAIANTSANMSNTAAVSISLTNTKGNSKGINDRLDYVGKAVRARTMKMVNNLKEAIKASLRKKYIRQKQPIPPHLVAGKMDNSIE